MRVEIVDSLDGLREREAEWLTLYRRLPGASVFTSPAWVLNWIESFATETSLRCAFVCDEYGLQAVLPMVPVSTRWRRIPVVALTACTNQHSVRSALLFDPALRESIFADAQQALRDVGGWDMLLLDGCAGPDSAGCIPQLPDELPVERWQHSCLPVHGRWEDYLAGRSRDLRRNLRRAEADLDAMGQIRFTVIEDDADRLYEQWVEVDRASWKADGGETVDSDAQTSGFYLGMLRCFAARQLLIGGVLSLDDRPIAVVICASDKGVCHTLKTAIREDLSSARLSLGALVMARLLAALWSRPGLYMIDFVSKQPYTERWSADAFTYERRVAFTASWRGQAAALLDHAVQRMTKRRSPVVQTSGN